MIDPSSETSSLFRHLGTLVAGILIRQGVIDQSYIEAVIGLVTASSMIVLAWMNKLAAKRIKADTVAVALQLPAGTRSDTLNSVLVQENLPTVDLGGK